ncbi:MAG: ABC transporter ATP-binding protein [Lyngbya sp. HA4199-MV5]|jgi:ABC-2 type transport system ATP-binding protein|nr:ABC transporter ATP-binding protein [Lyngbya sp. HA4199-MV5]
MIELHSISKSFEQREVLSDISLTIQPGEVVVLKGENGSGKTTLLNIILGILKPDRGNVKLCGCSPKDSDSKARVGVMLQKVEVPKNLRVSELISLIRSYYPNPLSTEEILDKVGLQEKSSFWCSKLSGGERKRLDLGIALAGNPKLLILDEPTVGLDEKGRKEFWQTLRLCVVKGVAVVIVTHNPADWQELETIATRSIMLQEGRLLEDQLLKGSAESDQRNYAITQEQPSVNQSQKWSEMLMAQIRVELLQLVRTPIYLLGIVIFCVITSLISSPQYGALGLVFCGGLAVLTFAIERVGKQIALERVEGWLKLLRVTSLQPTAYLSAKLAVSLLILAVILILVLAISASRIGGAVTFGNQIFLFISLLIGVIPFAIAGSAMGYLVKPKSLDQIAGISIPVALLTCGLSIPWLPKDIIVLSPFYHYAQLALWSIGSEHYDHHLWLNLLWLLTAGGVFSTLAIWAYQRDEVVQ